MARINPFNDNLAFQPKGTDQEARHKVMAAVEVVQLYCKGEGYERDVQAALAYIEDHCEKTEPICDEIRTSFLIDGAIQGELKKRVSVRAYNKLAKRLNGRSI